MQNMLKQDNSLKVEKLFDGENKVFSPLELTEGDLLVVS